MIHDTIYIGKALNQHGTIAQRLPAPTVIQRKAQKIARADARSNVTGNPDPAA